MAGQVAAPGMSQGLAHDHPDLVCAVCMQAFNTRTRKPVDIGCHTYCEACILASPSSFRRCPECRAAARNPHINYALMRLLGSMAPAGIADGSGTHAAGQAQDGSHSTANGYAPSSQAQDMRSRHAYGSSAGLSALQAELEAHPVDGPGAWGLGHAALTTGLSSLWQRRPHGRQTMASHAQPPATADGGAGIQGDGEVMGALSDGGDVLGAGRRASRRSARHRASAGFVQPPTHDGQPAGGESAGGLHLSHAVNSSQHVLVHDAVSHLPHAVQEARSQFWSWAGPLMGLLYLVSPLDLIPDFIPLLGWLDDMVVVGALLYWVCTLARTQQQRRAMSPPAPPPTPQPWPPAPP